MELRARIRPNLRHAGLLAALSALLVPAVAGTTPAEAAKAPVVKRATPKHVFVGQTLTLRGRHFRPGIGKNTVAFKRKGAKVVLVRSDKSTKKMLKVKLPKRLEKVLPVRNGAPGPDASAGPRARRRASASGYTRPSRSPIVGPERPPAPPRPPAPTRRRLRSRRRAQRGRGRRRQRPALTIDLRAGLRSSDRCKADTDGDGVDDGYEYQSARDLNDDEYQERRKRSSPTRQAAVPEPAVRRTRTSTTTATPAARPRSTRSGTTVPRTAPPRTLKRLSTRTATSTPPTAATAPATASRRWSPRATPARGSSSAGRGPRATRAVLNRGVAVTSPRDDATRFTSATSTAATASSAEDIPYYDYDGNGFLSDDERDEDADGLTNYDEAHGRCTPEYWARAATPSEKPYPITYAGTELVDPDTDGDGVPRRRRRPGPRRRAEPHGAAAARCRGRNAVVGRPCAATDERDDRRKAHRARPGEAVQPVPAVQQFADLRAASSIRAT